MRTRHPHKYLTGDPSTVTDEAGYQIEDGIIVDPASDPNWSKPSRVADRYNRPTREQLLAEEAAWAARSGPVYTTQKEARA